MRKDDYINAVYLELSSSKSNDPVPVDPILIDPIFRTLPNAVWNAVNAFCVSSNSANVAKCCSWTEPKAAPTKDMRGTLSPQLLESGLAPNGNLWLAFYIWLYGNNSLCKPAPLFTRSYASSDALVQSFKAAGFATALTSELRISFSVKSVANSVQSYKGFAGGKYRMKTPDRITSTSKPQTDGNKDTAASNPALPTQPGKRFKGYKYRLKTTAAAASNTIATSNPAPQAMTKGAVRLRSGLSALHLLAMQAVLALLLRGL